MAEARSGSEFGSGFKAELAYRDTIDQVFLLYDHSLTESRTGLQM